MGKASKRQKKLQDDDFYEAAAKAVGDPVWQSGVSAVSMDLEAPMVEVLPNVLPDGQEVTDAVSMETECFKRKNKLGVQTNAMKRGSRTTKQKKRKMLKLQKALDRSEQREVKVAKTSARKVKKHGLKSIY